MADLDENKMNEWHVFDLVSAGHSIDCGQLSICVVTGLGKPKYQVYCDNYKHSISKLYRFTDAGLMEAVKDYLRIYKGLVKDGLTHSRRRNQAM